MRPRHVPALPGIPSTVPGGRAARAIALTLGIALALATTLGVAWTPAIAEHARNHPTQCIDVPVARHATECCSGREVRVHVAIPRREADAEPAFVIRGKTYDAHDLPRYLRSIADMRREDSAPDAPSAAAVVIRADRATPWSDIQLLMGACAAPDVRIYKLQFVVRRPDSRPCPLSSPLDDPITTPLKEQLR